MDNDALQNYSGGVKTGGAGNTAPVNPEHKLVKTGWWTTVLVWPVGAIIAIILLTKGQVKHGVGMLCVCVLYVTVGWALINHVSDSGISKEIATSLEAQTGESGISCVTKSDTQLVCLSSGGHSWNITVDRTSGQWIAN